MMRDDKGCHLRVVHSNPEPVTGDARLGYFKDRAADAVSISNADLIIRKAFDGEIFPELSVFEIVAAQHFLPISISVELIDHHGTLLATVPFEVSLAIPIQIQAASEGPVGYRKLPNAGADQFALPLDFTWKFDIDRNELRHALSNRGESLCNSLIARLDRSHYFP